MHVLRVAKATKLEKGEVSVTLKCMYVKLVALATLPMEKGHDQQAQGERSL